MPGTPGTGVLTVEMPGQSSSLLLRSHETLKIPK